MTWRSRKFKKKLREGKIDAPFSARLVKRLRAMGFEGPFAGGKHLFMLKGTLRLTLPNPHKQEISVALLAKILKQAGVSRNEWLGL